MNIKQRKLISEVEVMLEKAKSMIEMILETEEETYDNMPEGLQNGERGEKISDAITNLQASIESCDDALNTLSEAAN